jgi:hypothetical protein
VCWRDPGRLYRAAAHRRAPFIPPRAHRARSVCALSAVPYGRNNGRIRKDDINLIQRRLAFDGYLRRCVIIEAITGLLPHSTARSPLCAEFTPRYHAIYYYVEVAVGAAAAILSRECIKVSLSSRGHQNRENFVLAHLSLSLAAERNCYSSRSLGFCYFLFRLFRPHLSPA